MSIGVAPEDIVIRRWNASDQDSVIELHVLGLKSTDAYAGRGSWDDDLEDIESNYLRPGGEFLVGLAADRLVAMGALQLHDDNTAEIRRMRVHPDFQRRGFGQKLLSMLEDKAASLGCEVIRLDTSVPQVAAQALYRKNGYVELGRNTTSGPLELILFEKRLSAKEVSET